MNKTKPIKISEDVFVKDYRMIVHMNMTKAHLSKHIGTFCCPDKPLHGKQFINESKTRVLKYGEYGKTTNLYYLNEPKSPTFKTLEALIENYNGKVALA